MLAIRKIRSFDEDFEIRDFLPVAQDIYIKAHEAMARSVILIYSSFGVKLFKLNSTSCCLILLSVLFFIFLMLRKQKGLIV